MLRSGKRPSLCPDLCKNKFGASASSKQCIWRSGDTSKAKKILLWEAPPEEDDGQVQISPISDLGQAKASRDRDGQDPCQAHLQLSDPPVRVVLATPAVPRDPHASNGTTQQTTQ